MWMRIGVIVIVLLTIWPSGLAAQGDPDPEATYADVPYVANGDYKQKVDVYLPADAQELLPVVLLVHGNGYTKWDMAPLAGHFLHQGYAAVAVEYRNPFPQIGQDMFCALAWVHSRGAEYGLDNRRIVVLGHSMGGFGAALLGIIDDPADLDVFMTGCDHRLPGEDRLHGVILYAAGGIDSSYPTYDAATQAQIEALITDQIDGSEPPFLLIHGVDDLRVRPESSIRVALRLQRVDISVWLVLLPDVGHFFTNPASAAGQQAIDAVDAFLEILWEAEVADLDPTETG